MLFKRFISDLLTVTFCSGIYSSNIFAFVLISPEKPILPVSPEQPEITFNWDGRSPTLKNKGNYRGGIYQDLSDTELFEQLISDAMAIWNNVYGAYIELVLVRDPIAAQLNDEDRLYSIVVQSNDNLSSAAFARPIFEDRLINDCDININDSAVEARDLAYTLVHELGHCLGFGHNHSNYNSIMGYARSKKNLSLGNDDKSGLIYLYPDPLIVDGASKELISCASIKTSIKTGNLKQKESKLNIWLLYFSLLIPVFVILRNQLKPAAPPPPALPGEKALP